MSGNSCETTPKPTGPQCLCIAQSDLINFDILLNIIPFAL